MSVSRAPRRPSPLLTLKPGELTVRVRDGVPPQPQRLDHAGQLGAALLQAQPELQRCTVIINNNRRRVLSWRHIGQGMEVSVHHAVLACCDDVVAVAVFDDSSAWTRLRRRFVELSAQRLPPAPPSLDPQGAFHDLRPLLQKVMDEHFPQGLEVLYGWGRWPTQVPRRSLRLGSCGGNPPALRIHPVLDAPEVPAWFIEFVLFHELLHVVLPPQAAGSRRVVHSAEFRRREQLHPSYSQALRWETEQVPRLLRRIAARSGRRARSG